MACYPQSATGLGYASYPVGPTPADLALPNPASNNTKGAYVEIVASLGFTANQIHIQRSFNGVSVTAQFLLDIATGAAASEVVVIPNLIHEANGNSPTSTFQGDQWILPLGVSSGTRVAARDAVNDITGLPASQNHLNVAFVAAGGCPGITTFTNLGADTTDSGGLQVDPGGTANTKGSYVQFSASLAAVAQFIALLSTAKGNTAITSARWCVDIATGAGGSEVVLIPDLRLSAGASINRHAPKCIPMMTYIAASTRVAIRASCSTNDATDRLLDMALLVGTAPAESSSGIGSYSFAA